MNCIRCNEVISEGRIRALPTARTCVKCSETPKKAGVMIWEHKTAPCINIMSQESAEHLLQLSQRRGGQGVSKGVQFKFNNKK